MAVGFIAWRQCSLRARFENQKKKRFRRFTKESELPFEKLARISPFFWFIRTSGGNRTHTVLLPLDFESSASTNSATEAFWSKSVNVIGHLN